MAKLLQLLGNVVAIQISPLVAAHRHIALIQLIRSSPENQNTCRTRSLSRACRGYSHLKTEVPAES